jgi:predicted AlkP superfamily phosphohydrolase/phosphomutase
MDETPKVILIGIDGGTFRVIKPGIKARRLPTFERIVETGISGVLRSTIPPATIPAFPTLMTGKNCGKHGIFDFMGEVNGESTLMDSTRIVGKTLWRVLDDHGKKSIVVNVPLTYPPENIDGIIVTGMLTPLRKDYTHPKSVMKKLKELTGDYPVQFNSGIAYTNPSQFLPQLHQMLEKRRTAIRFLMDNWKWDFFCVLFRATDIVSHFRWDKQDEVLSIYEHIDEILNELTSNHPNAYVFVFSDHGFGPYLKDFHINLFLQKLELLKIRERKDSIQRKSEESQKGAKKEQRLARLLGRMGVYRSRLRNIIPSKLWRIIRRFAGSSFRQLILASNYEVDISQSKAFFSSTVTAETQSITLNPSSPEEYEGLVERLKDELLNVKDPETGAPVVRKVFHRNDIYMGPFVDQAPDLILLLSEGYKATTTLSGKNIIEPLSRPKGTHDIEGIFLAKGPTCKPNYNITNISIQDLAPTILHLLKVPIPDDVDGAVKTEIFLEASEPAKRKPQYFKTTDERRKPTHLTKQEQEEIKERLRNLGYID